MPAFATSISIGLPSSGHTWSPAFGRIHWVDGAAVRLASAGIGDLAEREVAMVAHMNDDHADAVQLYANRLLSRGGAEWRMIGLDPDGCDLRRGAEWVRLEFETKVHDAEGARVELVRLLDCARNQAAAA